jgi:thiamine-phosphate pyrophosphorylase
MVTDRARGGAEALVERVGAAAREGVDLVQVRERDMDGGALADLVARCVAAVRGTKTRVVVNDRLDVALAAGAHGVHQRADTVPAPRARAMAPPGFQVGRSAPDVAAVTRATAAGGRDNIIFGTVYPSGSKPGRDAAGAQALAEAASATPVPVLAIGGMTPARLAAVRASGAAGFAAIGLFADGPVARLGDVVRDSRLAFDDGRSGG